MAITQHVVRQAQLEPILRTSSLNSSFSGSTSYLHLFRRAADIVVRFDDVRFTGANAADSITSG